MDNGQEVNNIDNSEAGAQNDKYLSDYISGQMVKVTPEELDAVQVFSRQLVEDYGYPKEHIQTRPQFRVKTRPSGKKEYPIDIAVFNSSNRTDDNLFLIVECKSKTRSDGKSQLEDYLRLSKAQVGVWFNGERRLFIRKIEREGQVLFDDKLPNIPKYGEKIEEIGRFRRKDLKPTHNLKATFKAIRNHLAANNIGATRDEILAQQLINIIFCKIYDEKFTKNDEIVSFRVGFNENPTEVKDRILELFDKVKRKYKDVLDKNDTITLDEDSISYVVGELQIYCLMDADRDVIADAFETFIGRALKGEQGQFFTPRNVIKMMVDILDPSVDDIIIDPACGSGGFLIEALRNVWRKLEKDAEKYSWSDINLQEEKMSIAMDNIRGIDKDYFLAKVARAYMALIGDGKSGIFCEDSLELATKWNTKTRQKIHLGEFDVVLTNPPFGSKIPVRGSDKLRQYELGHKWKKEKKSNTWAKSKLKDKESPQILFIERCLSLLKEGGRLAIVLPDGIYGNNNLGYIRQYILGNSRLVGIIDIPKESFMPNTPTKTSIMILQKLSHKDIPEDYPVFMAVAESCGHDRRGNVTDDDDILKIANSFKSWAQTHNFNF